MQKEFAQLKELLAIAYDVQKVGTLLAWDQQTIMPPRGAPARAEQMATLTQIAHEKFTDPAIGRLLDALRPFEESLPYDSDEASLIRVTRRDYEKKIKVPPALATEMARAGSLAYGAWVQARAESSFGQFLPYLQKNVELKLQYIDCLNQDHAAPYDVLLDDYEPGMKTAEVQACFNALKQGLIPLIHAIRANQESVSNACLFGDFPVEGQVSLCRSLLEHLGVSWESWRLDPTVHPFAHGGGQDIRITTHYDPGYIGFSLLATIHEFGHGLYEHQVSPDLARTPLSRGASQAMHESQSRLWENLVGRGRSFWQKMYPKVQETFPGAFAGVALEEFYRAINRVAPSFIRIEADEVTYPLHVILRFELEQEIVEGKIDLKDLPGVWNSRFEEYLGLAVPDDTQGVLQDVHWALGYIGYFPTYTLGSIIACQLWEKIVAEIPDLEAQIAQGEVMALREWLRANVHRHGRKFTSGELLQRVVGSGIEVEPFLRYLQDKFGAIYS